MVRTPPPNRYPERLFFRALPSTISRIADALRPGETVADFLREAVAKLLATREAEQ